MRKRTGFGLGRPLTRDEELELILGPAGNAQTEFKDADERRLAWQSVRGQWIATDGLAFVLTCWAERTDA